MYKFLGILTLTLTFGTSLTQAAEKGQLYTPEEFAAIMQQPRTEITRTLYNASFSERVALIKAFRDVQRNRAKITGKDYSANKIAITPENLNNLSQMSGFVTEAMDMNDENPKDYLHLINFEEDTTDEPAITEPQPQQDKKVKADEEVPAEPEVVAEKESDTIKHIFLRKKFGQ